MRIFFDTNVLVSAVMARGLSADLFQLALEEHEVMTGEFNLIELRRVLAQNFGATRGQIDRFEIMLRAQSITPIPAKILPIKVRDPDDAWVLASAAAASADVLVTGDKDLLSLAAPPLPILNPRQAWERLRKRV